MSYPTPQKTWQFSASGSPTINVAYGGTGTTEGDADDLIIKVKNLLKTLDLNAWGVVYSCNGSVAGAAGDGVDRWSTAADVVHANAGVAHSWIVLRQSVLGSNFQLLIDFCSGNAYQAAISYSKTVGFSGGSTTAAPTATDQCPLNSASVGTAANWGPLNSNHTGTFHLLTSSDGKALRLFVCTGGSTVGAWLLDEPQNYPTGWTSPHIAWIYSSGSAGVEGPIYVNLVRNANARGRVGSTNFAAYLGVEGCNSSELGTQVTGANDIDSTYPMGGVSIISTSTAGTRGRLGVISDLWTGLAALASASTYGSKQFAHFGDLIVPWDGSTTPSAA